jgi:hypothetical protein
MAAISSGVGIIGISGMIAMLTPAWSNPNGSNVTATTAKKAPKWFFVSEIAWSRIPPSESSRISYFMSASLGERCRLPPLKTHLESRRQQSYRRVKQLTAASSGVDFNVQRQRIQPLPS